MWAEGIAELRDVVRCERVILGATGGLREALANGAPKGTPGTPADGRSKATQETPKDAGTKADPNDTGKSKRRVAEAPLRRHAGRQD